MTFHPEALAAFRESLGAGTENVVSLWKGKPPRAWAKRVTGIEWPTFSESGQIRREVRATLSEGTLSDEAAWLIVMAWGGQHEKNAKACWEHRSAWLPIVHDLRGGKLDGRTAYRRFFDARIKGLGPAYFTKIIYFLAHKDGYILDQWTAKSMEILQIRSADDYLADVPWIAVSARMNGVRRTGWTGGTIAGDAPPELYDRYLAFLSALRERLLEVGLNLSMDYIEEGLFAGSEQKSKSSWRSFVEINWSPS